MTEVSSNDSYRSIEFWNKRWNAEKTEWQVSDFHPCLTKYASKMLLGPDKRVFVPLCGKTLDMLWLYKEGHRVVGVEGVEQVVVDYGKEHRLDFKITTTDYGKVYKTPDGRLQIIVCNLFDLSSSKIGQFDAIWDRASIIAISVCDREKYMKVMKDLLVSEFRYLVVTVDYTPTPEFSGPPSSITPKEMVDFLSDVDYQVLESTDGSVMNNLVKHGPVYERYCLLSPKSAASSA
ncbi:TPMT family [Trinorchestia longiramus]|nr:TPMT family [Trinorchestia longiramus]